MRIENSGRVRPWSFVPLVVAAACVSACGGGGGDSSGSTPTATDQSLSGVVIDGPIQGATVCLDLNNNGSCDAGEPTSGATDAQGRYTISGLTLAQASAAVPLIAVIPATAVDASTGPVGTAYTLSAPAGKGAVISPITHLVQAGVAQGLTLAASESAVAAQLQVGAASLYNDYTAASAGDNATLAAIVPVIVSSLQAGEPVAVSVASASTAGYWARQFSYTNASNFFLRYYYSSSVPDSAGNYTYYDEREQLVNGAALATSSLYDTALTATPQGWKKVDGSTPNTSTAGSPYVSTYGYGYAYAGTKSDTDVSGLTIAEVVAKAQDLTVNTASTIIGVNASALTGTMPAGAKIRKITNTGTATPVMYRVSDGFVGGSVTTLAGLVSAYPVPATPTAANTASMARLHFPSSCTPATGTTVCPQEGFRVAFGSSGAATYYLCDYDVSSGVQSNCASAGTGTYSLGVAADGSTPIIKFAGLPASSSIQAYTRVFVERSGHVYYGWQDKTTRYTHTRLNRVAFEALAAALGITAPTINDGSALYAGTWSASYSGADTGSCAAITIDAVGHIDGSCTSTTVGGTFTVTGMVSAAGSASFSASGSTSSTATFAGSFTATTGSGTWTWPSSAGNGTWTAAKQ